VGAGAWKPEASFLAGGAKAGSWPEPHDEQAGPPQLGPSQQLGPQQTGPQHGGQQGCGQQDCRQLVCNGQQPSQQIVPVQQGVKALYCLQQMVQQQSQQWWKPQAQA